jgi:hypothetical protein
LHVRRGRSTAASRRAQRLYRRQATRTVARSHSP